MFCKNRYTQISGETHKTECSHNRQLNNLQPLPGSAAHLEKKSSFLFHLLMVIMLRKSDEPFSNDDNNKGSEDKDVNNDDNDNDDDNDAFAVASYLLWNCSEIYRSICCCPVNAHYNWTWPFVSCISFFKFELFLLLDRVVCFLNFFLAALQLYTYICEWVSN